MYDQLFIFSLLMFSVFVVPIIADKTRIPGIVFYILFGVLFERFVFAREVIGDSFHIFAEIGKLYLMFIAGVEIEFYFFRKNAAKSVLFGIFTFIIPLVLGTAIIMGMFGYSAITAVLIACFFASHTLLSLTFINKFGIGNSEPVSVVVGATIISDIAVLGLLAIIADIARETVPAYYWAGLFVSWIVFIAVILYFVPKIARRVFQRFSEDGYAQFIFVFATACMLSWAAHFLRLESLIGAFFCGLALCRIIPKRGILMRKINFAGNTLFIPFFFIYAGMLIDPQYFVKNGDTIFLCVFLTAVAIAAKIAASFIFGRIHKYPGSAIMMTAGMTIQQAATTIVCAMIGFEVGIIDAKIFNAAMLHILLTCSIGEVISVHFAGKYARTLMQKSGDANAIEDKTLVFVPNIAACGRLLDFARMFKRSSGKYVISPLALAADNRESIADAETILGFCMNYASELEETYRPEMRIVGNNVDGILHSAAETRAGMVICPLENHSPALIDMCPPRLVFARIAGDIGSTKRIHVVFMPTSENRSDINTFIAEIKRMARLISADLVFHISENQDKTVAEKIGRQLRGAVNYELVKKDDWNAIKRDLPESIRGKDAILISMGTRHKLFRLPSADRYPFHLANRFVKNSVFAAYPPLSMVGIDDDRDTVEDDRRAPLEAVDTRFCDLKSITASIAKKIDAAPNDLYGILLSSMELYPVELIPGAILVHAHTSAVSFPRVFVWFQKENDMIPPTKISPHVLVIALNPLRGDPQVHLKTLSRIAGIFMNPAAGDIIAASTNVGELIEKLLEIDEGT